LLVLHFSNIHWLIGGITNTEKAVRYVIEAPGVCFQDEELEWKLINPFIWKKIVIKSVWGKV